MRGIVALYVPYLNLVNAHPPVTIRVPAVIENVPVLAGRSSLASIRPPQAEKAQPPGAYCGSVVVEDSASACHAPPSGAPLT